MVVGGAQAPGVELNEPLHALLCESRFWTDFFWLTEPESGDAYAALDDAVVCFHVGEGERWS